MQGRDPQKMISDITEKRKQSNQLLSTDLQSKGL